MKFKLSDTESQLDNLLIHINKSDSLGSELFSEREEKESSREKIKNDGWKKK